jgi:hypothetical protein
MKTKNRVQNGTELMTITEELKKLSYEEKLKYWDRRELDWRQIHIANTIDAMHGEDKGLYNDEVSPAKKNICGKWILDHFITENPAFDTVRLIDDHKMRIDGNPLAKAYLERELHFIRERKKRLDPEVDGLESKYYRLGFESVISNMPEFSDVSLYEFFGFLPCYCQGIADAISEDALQRFGNSIEKGISTRPVLRFQGRKVDLSELIFALGKTQTIYIGREPITTKELTKVFEELFDITLGNIVDHIGKAKGLNKKKFDGVHFVRDLCSHLDEYYEISRKISLH